jgi:hypothetical protein
MTLTKSMTAETEAEVEKAIENHAAKITEIIMRKNSFQNSRQRRRMVGKNM